MGVARGSRKTYREGSETEYQELVNGIMDESAYGRKNPMKKQLMSVAEMGEMLGRCEDVVYTIIKRYGIRTVTVDGWMRIPKEDFEKWYAGQERYRNAEDREKEREIEEATISLPEMARLLGI